MWVYLIHFVEKNMSADATHLTWDWFTKAFPDRLFVWEPRKDKAQYFINLKHGSMSVQEYMLKFTQLYRYAPHMVSYSRAQMSKLLFWVSHPWWLSGGML